jgi:hypothetical protein
LIYNAPFGKVGVTDFDGDLDLLQPERVQCSEMNKKMFDIDMNAQEIPRNGIEPISFR